MERVPGVAAVQRRGRAAPADSRRAVQGEDCRLNLSVDRVISILRAENQNTPLGEIDEGDTTYLLRQSGQFENLDQIRDLVVAVERQRAGLLPTSRR